MEGQWGVLASCVFLAGKGVRFPMAGLERKSKGDRGTCTGQTGLSLKKDFIVWKVKLVFCFKEHVCVSMSWSLCIFELGATQCVYTVRLCGNTNRKKLAESFWLKRSEAHMEGGLISTSRCKSPFSKGPFCLWHFWNILHVMQKTWLVTVRVDGMAWLNLVMYL